jgi:hypothetical protein
MRRPILGFIVMLLGGCRVAPVGEAQQPIVGGTTTTGYPFVGYLSADYGGGTSAGCTGTLVRDKWFLSASHCIEEDMGKVMGVKVTFEADADNATVWHTAKSWQQHPNYGKPIPPDTVYYINQGYDCSLIELDAPVTGVTPIQYGSTPVDKTWVGKSITQIGYGFTSGNGTGSGLKRELHTTIGDVHEGVLDLADNGTGTCQGDSGGPTLYDTGGGVLQVIGVSSYGSQGCPGGGSMSRTELCAAWLDMIAGPFQSPPDMSTAPDAGSGGGGGGGTGGGGGGGTGGGTGGMGGGSGGSGSGDNGGVGGGGSGSGEQMGASPSGCDYAPGARGSAAAMLLVVGLVMLALRRRYER